MAAAAHFCKPRYRHGRHDRAELAAGCSPAIGQIQDRANYMNISMKMEVIHWRYLSIDWHIPVLFSVSRSY
jgi:hypothetical protein